MPFPRHKAIPKTISQPIDASERSFLTTFPAEIRNRIYELLFTKDVPVLLHDGKTYRENLLIDLARDGERYSYEDVGDDLDLEELAKEFDVELHVQDHGFRHHFTGCVSLLQACRQVYHEAAGVLYGSNTFHFSRVPVEDDRDVRQTQTMFAPRWLSDIGSHFELLSKVVVDVDSYGPLYRRCIHRGSEIDILPFLRLIWANPRARVSLGFAQACLSPDDQQSPRRDRGSFEETHVAPLVLNNLLATLGETDALDIKKYARFKGLLLAVMLSRSRSRLKAQVVHKSCAESKNQYNRAFEILDDGRSVQWVPHDSTIGLLQLPMSIRYAVYDFACASSDAIVFDLDSNIAHGLSMKILHLCKGIRSEVTFALFHSPRRRPTLRLTSGSLITSFYDFGALKRWISGRTFSGEDSMGGCNIELCLNNSSEASLEDVRVNVKDLLPALLRLEEGVYIKLVRTTGGGTRQAHRKEVIITASSLLQATFLLLSDMVKKMPHKANDPIPQIWINGCGSLLCARFPATTAAAEHDFQYQHSGTSLTDSWARALGYQQIQELKRLTMERQSASANGGELLWDESLRLHLETHETCMGFWTVLRNLIWEDWDWHEDSVE
jgi:hypothetical protein